MKVFLLFAPLVAFLAGCNNIGTYTLYRNSITDKNMRLHIATFNSTDGDAYNSENCNLAASLFQKQDGVKTRFWREKGEYRK
jgi:hypothetical protein